MDARAFAETPGVRLAGKNLTLVYGERVISQQLSLLVAADLLAQRLFAPQQWPVGLMTVSVGGLYLLWLLAREARQRG